MKSKSIKVKNTDPYLMSNHIDVFIERLRKIRALNGNPSLFGVDNYVLKRMCCGRVNILNKM